MPPTSDTSTLPTLPDLLRPGLDLVFVGINPGEESARRGHYYAHPGNRFWRALSASGLVPRDVTFEDDAWLGEACGIGFTDVVKRVITDSSKVTRAEVIKAMPRFRKRIAAASPRVICFTGGRQCDDVFPGLRAATGWGLLPATLEGAEVWVMPSTSGLAARWRDEGQRVLEALAAHLGRTCALIEAAS